MRKAWTPSIVPGGIDQNIYLVIDDFGRLGRSWREADVENTDLETIIQNMLRGEYSNPVGVFGFNPFEGWSRRCFRGCRPGNPAALRSAGPGRAVSPSGFCRKA